MGDKKIVGPQCNMVYRKKKLGKETTELIKTYNGEQGGETIHKMSLQ